MMMARKPIGEVKDYAGKESGLGDAKPEAHDREARRTCDHRDPGEPHAWR
jgi:hypothetical protein